MRQQQPVKNASSAPHGPQGQVIGHPRERWLGEHGIVTVIGFVIAAEIAVALVGFNLYFQARVASPATTPLLPAWLVTMIMCAVPVLTILIVRLLIHLKRMAQVGMWRRRQVG